MHASTSFAALFTLILTPLAVAFQSVPAQRAPAPDGPYPFQPRSPIVPNGGEYYYLPGPVYYHGPPDSHSGWDRRNQHKKGKKSTAPQQVPPQQANDGQGNPDNFEGTGWYHIY